MTTEKTLLLTADELRDIVSRPDADQELLISLVEDTDANHPALARFFDAREGETGISFEARPRR